MQKQKRQSRTTKAPYYKWDQKSNTLAYFCYRLKEPKSTKELIAQKLGVKLNLLDTRIQHFQALSDSSRSKTHTSSSDVKEIFTSSKKLTDQFCRDELRKFVGGTTLNVPVIKDNGIKTAEIEIDTIYLQYWKMQQKYQSTDMSDMDWIDFAKLLSTMNIKTRGMKIEDRILKKNSFLKKSIRSEEGDAWLPDGSGLEIKTSFITPLKGSSVSLTGIRLWEEKVQTYLLIVVDISNLEMEPITYAMWVPKRKLDEFKQLGKLGVPGMKKSAAVDNKNVANGLRLSVATLKEWASEFPLPNNLIL